MSLYNFSDHPERKTFLLAHLYMLVISIIFLHMLVTYTSSHILLSSHIPVSYTHLDVYKRQILLYVNIENEHYGGASLLLPLH